MLSLMCMGIIVAMGPRLLDRWTSLVVPRLFQDSWLILWMIGWTIWVFRHRTTCWRQEFTWVQNPITPAERLAASIAVVMLIGIIVLEFFSALG